MEYIDNRAAEPFRVAGHADAVHKVFSCLTGRDAKIARLHFCHSLNLREIADKLRVSPALIGQRMALIKAILAAHRAEIEDALSN